MRELGDEEKENKICGNKKISIDFQIKIIKKSCRNVEKWRKKVILCKKCNK